MAPQDLSILMFALAERGDSSNAGVIHRAITVDWLSYFQPWKVLIKSSMDGIIAYK
jgi:hypothetical protein